MKNILMPIVEEAKSVVTELVDEAKAIIANFGTWLRSEAQKVLLAASQTTFGTHILNMISAVNGVAASGQDKMNSIVSAALTLGEDFLAGGGWTGVFTAVADFVRGVAQMLFADFQNDIAKVAAGSAA